MRVPRGNRCVHERARLPALADIDIIHELIRKVQDNEPVPEAQKCLISPGVTPLIEHAAMRLAQQADIRVAQAQAVRLTHGHAVAIKRFDRERDRRLHCLSACVALRAAAERFGYPELAQLLRRGCGERLG